LSHRPDAVYYAELEAGAVYLAGKTHDPAERAEHLKMAVIYRRRARGAAHATEPPTIH
jgi:hypothetical protein